MPAIPTPTDAIAALAFSLRSPAPTNPSVALSLVACWAVYIMPTAERRELDGLLPPFTRHPYTGSLLSAIPIPDPVVGGDRKRIILKGDIASPINSPSG